MKLGAPDAVWRPELAAAQLVEVTAALEKRVVQILGEGLRLLQSYEG
jgi:hypothetical protein